VFDKPASREQIIEMAGVVQAYLHGPAGLFARLEPREVQEATDTRVEVVPNAPMALLRQLDSLGPNDHLLGAFTTPDPTIRLFCASIIVTGYSPLDVVDHEFGHRFGFDHDKYQARAAMIFTPGGVRCTGVHGMRGEPLGVDAYKVLEMDPAQLNPCPVCRLYDCTVHAHGLMEDGRERAMLAAMPAEVPVAVGGTIPLARGDVAIAQLALTEADDLVPPALLPRLHDLSHQLETCQSALKGWLDSEGLARTVAPLRIARSMAYQINQAHWAIASHPDLAPRDWDTILAFR
jgi:hypothetical protein